MINQLLGIMMQLVINAVMAFIWLLGFVASIPLRVLALVAGCSGRFAMIRAMSVFMLCGLVWVPLTQISVLRDPVGSYLRLSKIGLGAYKAHNDVKKVVPVEWQKVGSRYHAQAWADNVAIASGVKREPLHSKIGGALVAPFKWVGGMFI